MKQILQDLGSGKTSVVDCPVPKLSNNSLKISSRVSLISSGTERMLVNFGKASLVEKAIQQPDKVKQVLDKIQTDGLVSTFEAVKSKISQPLPLGYSNVGIVEEVSKEVTDFKIGDRVVSNGNHADMVVVKKNLCSLIPDNVEDDEAAFTVVGSIALQGVRLAEPTIGETFVVIGVGLIGLLTVQILRANGCKVLAIDFDQKKLDLAAQFGAETFNSNSEDQILSFTESFSRNRGVDGVIITASSDSNEPIKTAAKISRKKGRIVLVGVVGLDLDRSDFYEKEISFHVSCSYGPGRYDPSYEEEANDYPVGYVRWTEQRNFEAFLDMLSSKIIDVRPLISSRYEFLDATKAYDELSSDPSLLGLLLDYKSNVSERTISSIGLKQEYKISSEAPSLGVIGAGNYSSRILIPALKKTDACLHTLVTANGISSKLQGEKAGFINASTNVESMLKNEEIDTVIIATRHDSHAELVISSLDAGKNVWVEKPLALDHENLNKIEETYKNQHDQLQGLKEGPQLMVGFNRRFSPHIKKMKSLLSEVTAPKSFMITVNAGSMPQDHWTQDPILGGGRIIGEACHFIDLIRFLADKKITSVNSQAMVSNSGLPIPDRSTITIGFEDGSLGTILYLSNGSPNFPKERIEVFSEGKVLQLDNFRKLKGFGWNNFNSMKLWSQDKGQNSCVSAFIRGLKVGIPSIPSEEIFEVSRITIEANEILFKN